MGAAYLALLDNHDEGAGRTSGLNPGDANMEFGMQIYPVLGEGETLTIFPF